MGGSGYWERFWRRRISRRRLLTGAVLTGGGLAAAAVAGCEDGGPSGGTPAPRASPVRPESVYPTDARQDFVPPPPGMTGGTHRMLGYEPLIVGKLDPHQAQMAPMWNNLSAVFSRLYTYKSHEEPTWDNIVPDLADGIPEMIGQPPDTYVVRLRRGVRFHDSDRIRRNFPGLAGRELTADDVIYSFERQRNPESPQRGFYYRAGHYEVIEKIEKVDDYTIRFTTKGPIAPFYHYLADTSAFIIPKEIVDQERDTVDAGTGPTPAERMIGTGPFMWGELKWGAEFTTVRNPNWFGWDDPELGRPYLDGYQITAMTDDASTESLFRAKKIDVGGFLENPEWVYNIKQEMPELLLYRFLLSGWVNSRLKTHCPPFNDIRVRRALHLATDRRQIIETIWKGEAVVAGPVPVAIKYWALPQEELERLPGYRSGVAEREEDIAEARALYEAAGRPELPEIWVADQPGFISRYMGIYRETMRRNLGVDLRTAIKPYPLIWEAFLRGCDQAAMHWGFDNGQIDLDDWLYASFHSRGASNTFGLSDPELDDLLDAQRREFEPERRRELGYEIQRYLLGVKGDKPGALVRLDYAIWVAASVAWPFVKNRVLFPWPGYFEWYANMWLDRSDPTWQGRPS